LAILNDTNLPLLGALLGELGKDDLLSWVLLLVLLTTRLNKERVRRHLATRLACFPHRQWVLIASNTGILCNTNTITCTASCRPFCLLTCHKCTL